MRGMNRLEINKLMERYVGSSRGYLGSFGSHPELLRFYADCGVDVIPTDYPGTNKDRFQAILEGAEPSDQAKIIRGILKRHPVRSSETRRRNYTMSFTNLRSVWRQGKELPLQPQPTRANSSNAHWERWRRRLGRNGRPPEWTAFTLPFTAISGSYVTGRASSTHRTIASSIFQETAFRPHGPKKSGASPQDTATIAKRFCAVMTVIDPLRNKASYAHPSSGLLDVPEAMLAVNTARTILHYVDAKLAAVP